MSRRVLFSAVKNEAPFLLEWVAYHRLIGFDRIVIVSNDCTDGTVELLDALQEQGLVEHIRQVVQGDLSPQNSAASIALERQIIATGDWGIWLDADEFLNIHVGAGHLDDLIAAIGDKCGAVILWRVFGDGGNRIFPGRHISEDYTRCTQANRPATRQVKTFFRKDDRIIGFGRFAMHRPVIAKGSGLRPQDFLGADGLPLSDAARNLDWLAGRMQGSSSWCEPAECGYALAQINHYCLRSPEMFLLKSTRGRGANALAGEISTRHTFDFYCNMNQLHGEDRSILRHKAPLDRTIDGLLALPAIAQAQALVEERRQEAVHPLLASEAYLALLPHLQQKQARALAGDISFAGEALSGDAAEPQMAAEGRPIVLTLPEKEAAYVTETYRSCGTVLEFGSGGSTMLAVQKPDRRVFSVESDRKWAAMMQKALREQGAEARAVVHHVDIGETKAWGRPKAEEKIRNWPQYAISVWDRPDFAAPDVVLIDGRFRVACFLVALMRIEKPVLILWDDYTNRRHYHIAETILPKSETIGRMARFDAVPGLFKPEHLSLLAQKMLDPE